MSPTMKTTDVRENPKIRFHGLEQVVGDLGAFGFPRELPPGTHKAMGTAILKVAAADGILSDSEREFLVGRARMLGTSDDELDEILAFDPASVQLDDVVANIPPAARRMVLYDAILTSRVDGFADKERAAAVTAARDMGIDPAFVNAVEAHLKKEDAVRAARIQLLTPDSTS